MFPITDVEHLVECDIDEDVILEISDIPHQKWSLKVCKELKDRTPLDGSLYCSLCFTHSFTSQIELLVGC